MQPRRGTRDQRLAFGWHLVEATTIGFLGVLSIIGLGWSWHKMNQTSVEISRDRANRAWDL